MTCVYAEWKSIGEYANEVLTKVERKMNEQQLRMLKLIEECSEVQHVACKILKHGYGYAGSRYERKKEALQSEIADLQKAIKAVEADLTFVD